MLPTAAQTCNLLCQPGYIPSGQSTCQTVSAAAEVSGDFVGSFADNFRVEAQYVVQVIAFIGWQKVWIEEAWHGLSPICKCYVADQATSSLQYPYVQLSKHALIQTFHGWQLCQKVVKTVRSDGTPSKAIPPLLNVHVYFAKACRCRVAIPEASKLAKTVASDGTPSKQPSSFRHVTSLDGRTY